VVDIWLKIWSSGCVWYQGLKEEDVSISLLCAWMNMHGAKNEFHLRVDSNFDVANIISFVVAPHVIFDGDVYMPTNDCTL
jgi:hypothetical protein